MRLAFLLTAVLAGCSGGSSSNDMAMQMPLAIGSPCTPDGPTSSVCGPFPKYFCDADHPNGYCKTSCHTDADCPAGSLCAGAGVTAPGECHKKCTQATKATDCRLSEGYVCKDKPNDASGDYCDVPEMGDGGA
jgi:hypothetical protein